MTDVGPDNGQGAAPAELPAPVIRVLAQYVKDSSFENPGAPQSLRAGLPQPQIDLALDVSAGPVPDAAGVFETALRITATATRDGAPVFVAELVYAALMQLENVYDNEVEPILLIEGPRLIFPFARMVLADMTREGGFPPLMLDPVDFTDLYRRNLSTRQGGAAPAPVLS